MVDSLCIHFARCGAGAEKRRSYPEPLLCASNKPDSIESHYWLASAGNVSDDLLDVAAREVYDMYKRVRVVAGLVNANGTLAWHCSEAIKSIDALAHAFDDWIKRGKKGGIT